MPISDVSSRLSAVEGKLTTLNTEAAIGVISTPAYRGTFDVFWSFLLRLSAGIYSAIHFDYSTPEFWEMGFVMAQVEIGNICPSSIGNRCGYHNGRIRSRKAPRQKAQ